MPSESGPTDEELVRRIRAGDASAGELLFDRHLPQLRAKARATLPAALRGRLGESDVIQDAYMAAFLGLGGFEDRGDGSFARWLRQILEHKVQKAARRHTETSKRDARREVRVPTGAEGLLPLPNQVSPGSRASDREQAARLREEVEGLTEDHRTVIRLVHEQGLTLVEAGARMGRSPDAVRKLYGRALARLADRIGGPEGAGA